MAMSRTSSRAAALDFPVSACAMSSSDVAVLQHEVAVAVEDAGPVVGGTLGPLDLGRPGRSIAATASSRGADRDGRQFAAGERLDDGAGRAFAASGMAMRSASRAKVAADGAGISYPYW